MEIKEYNRDDPQYKVTPYGAPPEREKRKLTPELDKATAAFSPLQTFAKNAVNAATFGQHDRLQSWKSGTSLDDEREFTARTNEANPKSAFAGGLAGHALQAVPLSVGAAATVPALAANTARAAMMREGGLGLLSSAAGEGVKVAEGRGDFDAGNVLKGGAFGVVGGGVGHTLPGIFGHSPSMAANIAKTPLNAAQKANMATARGVQTDRGFTGNAALDLAQTGRQAVSAGDRSLGEMAANAERIIGRANPAFRASQEAAIRKANVTAGPGLKDIHRAIANPVATPSNVPSQLTVSAGVPVLKRWLGSVNASIPSGNMTARNTRAAELLRDPAMVDRIGLATGAQLGAGAGGRTTIDTLDDLRRRFLSGG